METKITSRVLKGFIIACILIVLDVFFQKKYNYNIPDRIHYTPWLPIVFLGVIVSCILFVKQSGGRLAFGEIFAHGFRTAVVVAFIMAAYTFISIKFIYPPPGAAEMEAAVKAIEEQGSYLHNEAVQMANAAAKNRWILYVSLSIFATMIPGLLGAVLTAFATKKN
ncbi:MAG: DUF4199 domain-containing protein [Chitinophagaceae bacterium]